MPGFGGKFDVDRYTCGECGDPAPWGNGLCSGCRTSIEKVLRTITAIMTKMRIRRTSHAA